MPALAADNLLVANQLTVNFPETSFDAFGIAKSAEPYTIFDSKQVCDNQPMFWDSYTSGNAVITYVSGEACSLMQVTGVGQAIRQTFMRFNYQPSKAHEPTQTYWTTPSANTIKRVGFFDGYNGIFYELSGSISSYNIMNNGVITERAVQGSWNQDNLNGNGASALTFVNSGCQIFKPDFEWLGVGKVRVAHDLGDAGVISHIFNHANRSQFTGVYMATPNLPLRYEIISNGGTGVLKHICASVSSNGGHNPAGNDFVVSTKATSTTLSATSQAIVGFRLKAGYDCAAISTDYATIMSTTNTPHFRYFVSFNPTINSQGTLTWVNLTGTPVEYAIGGAAHTLASEGDIFFEDFVTNESSAATKDLRNKRRLGIGITGNRDTIFLCGQGLGTTPVVYGGIGCSDNT